MHTLAQITGTEMGVEGHHHVQSASRGRCTTTTELSAESRPCGEVIGGSLPRRAHRLVLEWLDAHRAEIGAAWIVAQSAESPGGIEPLRRELARIGVMGSRALAS